ncbi:MAG: DinB family protein [Candidatus Sumerlaeia bacterium]|nr:DinB family protein [Candidatus Sumerlaeia bacterium]
MSIAQGMVQELQHEARGTRAHFERLPDDRWDYKPHPKSMSLGELASHMVDALSWAGSIVQVDTFELQMDSWVSFKASNRAELLARFDETLPRIAGLVASIPDEAMFRTWTMNKEGRTVLQMPRIAVLRGFILNHMIHHRAQLGVYLRILDVEVPSVYGPSADDPGPMGAA